MVQITHCTSPNYTDWICTEYTLYWKILPRSGFLSNLRLPWKTEFALNVLQYWIYFLPKTEFALKFFTVLNILLHLGCLSMSNFALALKARVCFEFTVLNIGLYFLSFRIFEQLSLALKFFKPGGATAPPSYAYVYILYIVKHQPPNIDLSSVKTSGCLPQAKCLVRTFESLIKTIYMLCAPLGIRNF